MISIIDCSIGEKCDTSHSISVVTRGLLSLQNLWHIHSPSAKFAIAEQSALCLRPWNGQPATFTRTASICTSMHFSATNISLPVSDYLPVQTLCLSSCLVTAVFRITTMRVLRDCGTATASSQAQVQLGHALYYTLLNSNFPYLSIVFLCVFVSHEASSYRSSKSPKLKGWQYVTVTKSESKWADLWRHPHLSLWKLPKTSTYQLQPSGLPAPEQGKKHDETTLKKHSTWKFIALVTNSWKQMVPCMYLVKTFERRTVSANFPGLRSLSNCQEMLDLLVDRMCICLTVKQVY